MSSSNRNSAFKLDFRNRNIISVIGDQDTVTGMLLAGVGHVEASTQRKNYFIVDSKTSHQQLEAFFIEVTSQRHDIAVLLICQHIAEMIRPLIDSHDQMMPAIVEIPSKDHPYDPEKDTLMKQVNRLFSSE